LMNKITLLFLIFLAILPIVIAVDSPPPTIPIEVYGTLDITGKEPSLDTDISVSHGSLKKDLVNNIFWYFVNVLNPDNPLTYEEDPDCESHNPCFPCIQGVDCIEGLKQGDVIDLFVDHKKVGLTISDQITPQDLEIDPCTDNDKDGYYLEQGCGDLLDCNDTEKDINPGEDELCDLIDNNCNGNIDEDDGDCKDNKPYCLEGKCVECIIDNDCNDTLWCNGEETCIKNKCLDGDLIDCSDDFSCTDDSCDEDLDRCDNTPNHDNCPGTRICDPFTFSAPSGCGQQDIPDRDKDTIPDENDNCPLVDNPDQRDSNNNGLGDVCELDYDGDNVIDDRDYVIGDENLIDTNIELDVIMK